MITMNPLVISHCLLPSSKSPSTDGDAYDDDGQDIPTYEVTDSLASPDANPATKKGLFVNLTSKLTPQTITYTARMQNLPTGLKTEVVAPMGFRSFVDWIIHDRGGDAGLELEEKATVVASRFLIGLATGTMEQSHRELVQRFVARLMERQDGWRGNDEDDRGPAVPAK
jgi:hypothetical protein